MKNKSTAAAKIKKIEKKCFFIFIFIYIFLI